MTKIVALEARNLAADYLPDLPNPATVLIHLPYPGIGPYLPYPPAERRKRMARTMRETLKAVKALLGDAPVQIAVGSFIRPRAVRTVLPLNWVAALAAAEAVSSLRIEAIEGMDKVEKVADAPPARDSFWCIRARFAVRVEHAATGRQLYEDRLLLVKASGEEEARQKLRGGFGAYAEPYLNSAGRLVSWQFEAFLDACDTGVQTTEAFLHPEGVEVFSELKRRNTKPAPTGRDKP